MTRQLVLTNEAARHPFRQRLPRPQLVAPVRPPRSDAQFFLTAVAGGFVAFYGFLA